MSPLMSFLPVAFMSEFHVTDTTSNVNETTEKTDTTTRKYIIFLLTLEVF